MKFIHTSDWHLGRILHGKHLTEDQFYILQQFIYIIKNENPDAILIAGDLYDRSVPPVEAVELLDNVFTKILIDFNIPIICISGNHDSPDRINFGSKLLQERKLFIKGKFDLNFAPITLEDNYGKVNFYTIPYTEPVVIKALLKEENIHNHNDAIKSVIDKIKCNLNYNERNVLVCHAFVTGGEESESERPLSVGGASSVDYNNFECFNYTALGHLHRPQKCTKENIKYSGSLMKYSFSEVNQEKCIYIIEMDEKGEISTKQVCLKPKRDLRYIEGHLKDIINDAAEDENREDYLLVNLLDEGAILDPIGKLRQVYPNVLRIDREDLKKEINKEIVLPDKNFNNMSHIKLFKSFYTQVTGKEFLEDKEQVLEDLLKEYYSEKGVSK
ncbi:nuclease SbcCD subunit D [Clostridium acetireducens DSM 10703]|uniref:Nuclease SbcCD subunit D n=1 Tax=Clostridium acetireducens DSM 10703 TaxID=1121290 RepID=A0A1E8F1V6_9CLOT|nr:exonuclease SbcCD subunit D [Clostridium acetireducens]OFI07623.1 nuclease SbcCD subunit D [Clostridium acetireducens DSM 10703]